MKSGKLYARIVAVLFSASVTLGLVGSAQAYDVYRRVAAIPAVVGVGHIVTWTRANFGVSGNPNPNLSFFYYVDDNAARGAMPVAQCFVKVHLPATGANPNAGDHDDVAGVGGPYQAGAGARAFPWRIDFDNHPAGHWNIAKAVIINLPASNNAASDAAASGFNNLAIAGGSGVTVIDGSLAGCRAQ